MKLLIEIDDEMVCNDIKCKALEPTSATDEVIINALYNGVSYEERPQMKTPIYIEDVFRLVAGHSIYSGDSILSAFTCLSEGKDVKTIKPLDISYAEIANMRGGRE